MLQCWLSYAYSSLPSSLLCRDEQLLTIRQWVGERVKEGKGGALYISGAPGTGKTACVSHLLEEVKVIPQAMCVCVRVCMRVCEWNCSMTSCMYYPSLLPLSPGDSKAAGIWGWTCPTRPASPLICTKTIHLNLNQWTISTYIVGLYSLAIT